MKSGKISLFQGREAERMFTPQRGNIKLKLPLFQKKKVKNKIKNFPKKKPKQNRFPPPSPSLSLSQECSHTLRLI